ncbi:MAG: exonuclease SbcCD subunit D [Cyclobacteriaceae bacterium]
MRILHTADWHLGKRLMDYSRLPEQHGVMAEICEIAEREEVDAVIVAGDLFDTYNPGSEAVELLYRTLKRLSKDGQRPVIAIAGNHDSADRIEAPDPLARECGILFAGYPDSHILQFKLETGLEVMRSEEGFAEVKVPGQAYPLRLLLTPYANEVTMRRYLGEEDREDALRQMLAERWQHLADTYCDDQGVNILTAHLYVMKKGGPAQEEPDDEKPILHMGGAQAIYTENFPKGLQYVALGHLHRYQTVDTSPCPVVYSSSPLSYSFSEASQQKYVAIIDAEPGAEATVQKIPLDKGRKLIRKRFEAVRKAVEWLSANPDTFIELTLVTETYLDARTKKQLYNVHDGIVSLIPEVKGTDGQPLPGERRMPDMNLDIRDLFRSYVEQKKGHEPTEDMMQLFNEILEAQRR